MSWVRRESDAHGAVEGLLDDGGTGARVGGQAVQPGPDLPHGRGRQQPVVVHLALGDREQRRVPQAPGGEHPGQVSADLLDRVGRRPVEHDGHRGAALGGRLQEAPGDLVGVPCGRGDEEPEVGSGEQLRGQRPVALLDRVDVGGVQDRESGGHRVGGDELEGAGVAGGPGGAGQAGQDALLVEPVDVGRVVHEHGRAGGGTEHAGLGDPPTDQGVHQRRLAGPGRPTDDGQQRRLDLDQPGQDVVLELVDHLAAHRAVLLGARHVERERHRRAAPRVAAPGR